MSEELRKGQSPIPRKRPRETRYRRYNSNIGRESNQRYGALHCCSCSHGICGLVENLDDGKPRGGSQCIVDISDTEKQDENENKGQCAVDEDGLDDDSRDDDTRVADFFTHVDGAVEAWVD
jgi:hypothetical protein